MGELTEKHYWDATHLSEQEYWNSTRKPASYESGSLKSSIKSSIKTLLGKKLLDYMRSYEDHILWEEIYEKYMPKAEGMKVVEVGSAPGDYLARLNKRFKFTPYGIEYSDSGVALNRQIFAANGINPDNVIHADFLSEEVHSKYKDAFDIVVSRGFIEHFTDVEEIIRKHVNLLADGGYLLISIPNLRGINYLLARFFHKDVIPLHNLDIMNKECFEKLFDSRKIEPLFCDYYGLFNFGLFNTKKDSPLAHLLSGCMKLQLGLNAIFRLLFRKSRAECRFSSPALIFIGRKREPGKVEGEG